MKALRILVFLFVPFLGFTQSMASEGKPLGKVETTNVSAGQEPKEDNNVYNTTAIEVKPEYPGGAIAFFKYIGKKYRTPNVKGLQGKVIVTFVIEKDGSVTDIKVLKDIGYGTGEEAIRVLQNCEKWIPGEQNGKKVRVAYTLPITIVATE